MYGTLLSPLYNILIFNIQPNCCVRKNQNKIKMVKDFKDKTPTSI